MGTWGEKMVTKYEIILAGIGLALMMGDFNLGIEIIGHIVLHESLSNLIDEVTK